MDYATYLAELDHIHAEIIKETRQIDDMSQGHTEPGHPNIQEYEDDDAFLIKKEQVNDKPVQKCHYLVNESKNYDYSDSSVDSGIGSKDENQCLSEREITNENSTLTKGLSTEHGIRQTIIRNDTGTTIRRRCDTICKKLNLSRIFLSVSIVGNIVLVIVVLLLATRLGVTMEAEDDIKCPLQQLLKDSVHESLCIPCDYLGSHVTAEDTLFNAISSCGNKFCCVRNASLQKLVLLMIQEGYTREVTTERLTSKNHGNVNKSLETRSRQIAAHLYANVTSLPDKLTWQTEDGFGSAFMQGITLTPESRLKVPEAGFYFIYSAVTFKCQLGSRPLTHMINRQHRGRPNAGVQQLLLSKTSECGPDGFYTSFLAGVLKLTSNDELSVNLTDISLSYVYRATPSNYFGLYLL